MTAEGSIVISRGSAYTDRARAYKVMVDGAEVGRIRNGETQRFAVPAGDHELFLKVDWTSSPRLRIAVAPGSSEAFTCGPNASPATALIMGLLKPKGYLKLEPADKSPV